VTGPLRLALATVAAVTLGVSGGAAYADEPVGTKAKAIALFDEGIKEMRAGNHEKACKAFEASNRLLPDSGTRGSLARCYTQLGKIAQAWTLWRELSDTALTADLRTDAAAQAKKLEPRLAKYTIKVASSHPGLTVTVAGQPADPTLDVPVPIDPGTYPVLATAPDRVAWKGELIAAEGKTSEILVPPLAVSATAGPGPLVRRGRGRRIAGLTIAGLGIGGLAAGGVFGVIARGHNADARDLCGGDVDRCDPARTNDAQAKVDDARSAANISTIAAIAGGALVAAGVILYITAPKSERRAVSIVPLVDPMTAGFALTGRY
jgi:hypothetical protein